jgi:hypothetical protein
VGGDGPNSPVAPSVAFAPMQPTTAARMVFGLTALVVAVGVVVQLFAAADHEGGFFTGTAAVLNVFCYFTIQSNIILGVGCFLLATEATSSALWFRVLRMIGIVGITLTFVVFQLVLRGLQDLTGEAAFADVMLHTVSPILGVAGWLLFGPRRLTDRTAIAWTIAYVLAWTAFTMIRGAIVRHGDVHFYPYPFLDAAQKGYPRVILNMIVVALVFLGLCIGARTLDRWLIRRRTTSSRPPSRSRLDGPVATDPPVDR